MEEATGSSYTEEEVCFFFENLTYAAYISCSGFADNETAVGSYTETI